VNERDWETEQFERHRAHLRSVAYRMLGSMSEADDAVQEAWLRLNRSGTGGVDNLGGWLTTVVARVCLDMLRARRSRPEPSATWLPEPVVTTEEGSDPAKEVELADSVGLALLVVLETLTPAERLAFVLHDMFAVPFEEIAPMVERTPAATRQLASRARRRVRGAAPRPDADLSRQREIVDAFLAASRSGDFDALVQVLDPDVVLRIDTRAGDQLPVKGAEEVARRVLTRAASLAPLGRPAVVNGAAGVVVASGGRTISVVGFTIEHDQIVEIDVIANPEKLSRLGAIET
jgi:RNA polymerase sigma factor (sigma-70 family)